MIGALTEADFRMAMNADVCATTKMAEGINSFVGFTEELQAAIRSKWLDPLSLPVS